MKFSEVIGQEEAKHRLLQLVEEDRLPHAMMLCGPQGCGKMALALAFASYLLGEREGTSAASDDHERRAEAMLKQWSHPDLHFTYPVIRPAGTSAEHKMVSEDFISEWREMLSGGPYFTLDQWLDHMGAANQQALIGVGESDSLIHQLSLKSSQGGRKVSIVWLPERMNADCANKLLKLFEEPPAMTTFIMVSEEPDRLLETIRSRTQRIDIRRIDTAAIEQALVERRGIDPEAARRVARLANGSWTKALEELDANNENRLFLDMFMRLMRRAYMRDIKDLKRWSEEAAGYGRERQKRLLAYFSRMTRESFMYNFHEPELNYMTQEEEGFARNFARFINEDNVIRISRLYADATRDIAQNGNAKIVFFDLALEMIMSLIPQKR